MSKRIRNYRTGDRAEDLGIFLLKAFCAMAPIPRQEDFGLADAVATFLRSEGRFWYAEDSFLVQFKSRTEKNVTLEEQAFERWLAQDLSILVGRVNLIEGSIELFTLGTALFDQCVHEAKSLVAWLLVPQQVGEFRECYNRHLAARTPLRRGVHVRLFPRVRAQSWANGVGLARAFEICYTSG